MKPRLNETNLATSPSESYVTIERPQYIKKEKLIESRNKEKKVQTGVAFVSAQT